MSDERSADEPSAGKPAIGNREAILERRNNASARVSETTRLIGLGLLAIFYAIISGSDAYSVEMRANWPQLLRLMALCGVLAVLLDYLHYVFGYFTTDRALDRTDEPNSYDQAWATYRLEHVCFWTKQASALAGCCFLIFLVGQSFS
jgi:hypothetical protein